MSKVLYACFRENRPEEFSDENINLLSKRLEPDNITFKDPEIVYDKNKLIAVFNPNDSLKIRGTNVCLGNILNSTDLWWKPKSRSPDGSYALFRGDDQIVEVIGDMLATRTIWYYHDDNLFLSSTSQRAIIFFLRSFQLNEQAISWMISTGTLGPGYSWDDRLQPMAGDSILTLDHKSWKIHIEKAECVFRPVKRTDKKHYIALEESLIESFSKMDLDYNKWVLPLSGGFDSRAIFCMLKAEDGLNCVTWGLESSLIDKSNDAYIAKELADKYDKKHKYYLTDLSKEPIDKIFNRFLISGEGRICDIGAYLDGFKIWKDLFEEGIHGIIRGDEGFGARAVMSGADIRFHMRFPMSSEFSNLKNLQKLGISKQKFPDWLNRYNGESLNGWRDRVYHEYEMPFIFAALNDLKLSYVEVINPLLTREIISTVRTLPIYLRTNKKLFRKIVKEMDKDISFAEKDATATMENIFANKSVKNEILTELNSPQALSALPLEFVKYLIDKVATSKTVKRSFVYRIKYNLKRSLPELVKNLLRGSVLKVTMDYKELSFRAYVVSKMNHILTEDSNSCKY